MLQSTGLQRSDMTEQLNKTATNLKSILELNLLVSALSQSLLFRSACAKRQWHPTLDSCLENPMDRGAWWAAVHGVAKSSHDWETSLSLFTFMHWRRKWRPTPVFLPGESQGRGTWWAVVYGVEQSRTRLKRPSSSSSANRSCVLVSWPQAAQ